MRIGQHYFDAVRKNRHSRRICGDALLWRKSYSGSVSPDQLSEACLLQLRNLTPFSAERSVLVDRDGNKIWTVVVKATFEVNSAGIAELHSSQEPVCLSPVYSGEPGSSSLLRESEMVPEHPGTAII